MKCVLVVEDESFHRHGLCTNLQAMGFRSLSAENGQEAWEILEREPIDLVLTDYRMPAMTGLELIRKIKGHTGFRHIPIILLTADLDPTIPKLAEKLGVHRTFIKPFKFQEVVKSVATLLDPPLSPKS